jgi:hypothetical protein
MTRTQWTLTAVLLFQLLVLLLIAAPWSSGDGSTGPRVLLPELEGEDPSKIEVGAGDARLTLIREADGWVVDQADGYPADGTKVDRILDDLRQLEVRRPVVTGSRYHDALKVGEKENERRLSVASAETGDAELVLFLGTSPNYGVTHVRRGDEDEVYEARGLSPWDLRAEPASWIDTQLIDAQADDVISVRLANAHGEFVLGRKDGAWELEAGGDASRSLDAAKVDAFVRTLASLRFSEPAGRIDGGHEFGFGTPAATLELVVDVDGQISDTFELVVGDEFEAGSRYSHRSGSEFGVVLAKVDADRLLDKTVEELLVETEEGDGD